MDLTKESIIKMHALQRRRTNDEEVLIGRTDISNFIILPEIGVEIIDMLDQGQSIAEVEAIMEERMGEPVDVLDYVRDLIGEYQFVHMVDGVVIDEPVERRDHFVWITEGAGNFLFNKVAYWFYALLLASGIAAMLMTPNAVPVYSDMVAFQSLSVSLILFFIMELLFLFLHELAHLMAARSLGVGSRIGISHRLVFPVAETNMSNIALVEPHRRHRAFWAGMAWDAAWFSIGMWLLFLHDAGVLSLTAGLLAFIKMLNLSRVLGIGFQFMFFMKTDVYFMFVAKYGCNNLLDNTTLYLRKFLGRLTAAQEEEWRYVDEREKRVIRWYAWLYMIGVIWAFVLFVGVTLRVMIEYVVRVYAGMTEHSVLSWPFVDGVLLIVITLIPFGVLLWSWSRSWMNRRVERNAETF